MGLPGDSVRKAGLSQGNRSGVGWGEEGSQFMEIEVGGVLHGDGAHGQREWAVLTLSGTKEGKESSPQF